MLNKKSVDDINVNGKRVLCRCDFNVPLDGDKITDETRLVAALPTIKKLIADGGKVILCSHLGKPKGADKAFSLAPVAKRLSELLGQEVKFAADDTVVGDNARAAVEGMNNGDVILLENTRFRAEETKNGDEFSKDLASIADVFVNDAFGTAHRAHCSNVGVTKYVDTAVVGYLMQKEIDFLGNAVNNPVRPFVAILGGSKVSSKISVINNLLDKVDTLIIGGGMSYTFQKAHGGNVGQSLVEEDYLDYAKEMMAKAEATQQAQYFVSGAAGASAGAGGTWVSASDAIAFAAASLSLRIFRLRTPRATMTAARSTQETMVLAVPAGLCGCGTAAENFMESITPSASASCSAEPALKGNQKSMRTVFSPHTVKKVTL